MNTIQINRREILTMFQIDNKSIDYIAKHFNISHNECKNVLRHFGMTIPKNQEKNSSDYDFNYNLLMENISDDLGMTLDNTLSLFNKYGLSLPKHVVENYKNNRIIEVSSDGINYTKLENKQKLNTVTIA